MRPEAPVAADSVNMVTIVKFRSHAFVENTKRHVHNFDRSVSNPAERVADGI